MTRRYLIIAIMAALALAARAQYDSWQRMPVFNDSVTAVVQASNKVYCQSGFDLFSYEPDTEECFAYSKINKLSDTVISSIHYNADGKYLLIAYENCNIDVLYDDGRIINLPEILDAQISGKAINAVAFGEGYIGVATTFGFVLYDEAKMQVKESAIYGVDVINIAIANGNLIIGGKLRGNTWSIMSSPISERHYTLDKFEVLANLGLSEVMPVGQSALLLRSLWNGELSLRTVNWEANTLGVNNQLGIYPTQPTRYYSQGLYTADANYLYLFDFEGNMERRTLPEPLRGQHIALLSEPDKIWVGDSCGIARYDMSGSALTLLNDKIIPANAGTVACAGYMRWSPDGKRLYVSNITASQTRGAALGEYPDKYQTTNIIENGYARDVSGFDVTGVHAFTLKYQARHGNKRMYGDPTWMVEDPDDSDIYYIANNHEGVYKMRYNAETGRYDQIGVYNSANSPIYEAWGSRAQDVNIDSQGNLWVSYRAGGDMICVLPAAKRKLDSSALTISDWVSFSRLSDYNLNALDQMVLICKQSTMVFTVSGKYQGGLVAIDTKGTYDNHQDDATLLWRQFTDQDGITFTAPDILTFLLEDRRGCVWVGSELGVFELPNPANATDMSMTVRRIKVPRNDGTNYADYLLDSDQINWMCQDPSGRKWIATENSGLYLVSETGDQIIRSYNTTNSPLPTNSVLSVECDPQSNIVYVGTPYGLYTVLSDSSAPCEDYSEILAYPNPVRPEYTGDVTIKGLMDNSVVKIADASGNVVRQMRSEGGMVTWDVCNEVGRRVASGVYYIYASRYDGSSSTGAVSKIVVIN